MDKKENKKKTNKKETVQRNAKSKHNLCACTIRFSEPEQKKKKNGDKWYILEYFVGRRRRWRWKTKIATTTNFGVYKVFFKRVISIVKGNNEERREEIRWWDKIRIRIVVFLFLFLRIHCSIRFNFSSTKRIRSFYVYIYIYVYLWV